ncbi:hypothetical protein SAMN05216279_103107 [Pseudomonas oryzihabitans]|uniref:Uncharacterized protein n=1 Tax=Pseudomonas oryzihabitans TaxID=47885 RepID=A0A1G5MVZ8_9PSED|nr:hypothetical protein SAMN05216279_103107 [Pseudomonas psychrotolerans]
MCQCDGASWKKPPKRKSPARWLGFDWFAIALTGSWLLIIAIAYHWILRSVRIAIRLICRINLIGGKGFGWIRLGSLRQARPRDSRVNSEK